MTVERIRSEERHRCYTDLIDNLAITAEQNDVAFRRIRTRFTEIQRWFSERAAWPAILTRDMVRLIKTPAIANDTQGLPWASGPRDYEMFVWLLWYEEQLETNQFVCSEMVRDIEAQIRETVGPDHFTWNSHEDRRALERAALALVGMGALRRVDGSISEYVRAEAPDALYEYTGVARHLHIRLPRDVEAAVERNDYAGPVRTDDAVTPEQRLYRTLLLSPALYAHHDPEGFAVLSGRDVRHRIEEDLRDRLGWDLEVTRHHASLLRPAGRGQGDATFPRTNAAILHVVLLMCGRVRDMAQTGDPVPDERDRINISKARFHSELLDLRAAEGGNWGKGLGSESLDGLADMTLSQMREWGLVEEGEEEDMLRFLTLSARYFGVYSDEAIASFDDDDGEET